METTACFSNLLKLLVALAIVYCIASLAHFVHNAEFIDEYPNLPVWLTRYKVYVAWALITLVGIFGFILIRVRLRLVGLLLIAVYAGMGFDGLGHYAVAPMASHTVGANVTILSEVAAAALLIVVTLYMLKLEVWRQWRAVG